jgi:hypothetical protein
VQEQQTGTANRNSKQENLKKREKEMQKLTRSAEFSAKVLQGSMWMQERVVAPLNVLKEKKCMKMMKDERGDVPGWVLVVLMTTGLVTAIWTIAAPRLSAILKNSLDAMNGIR